jgi:hypothetical protein
MSDDLSGAAHDPREGRQFMDCRACANYGSHTYAEGCIFYEQKQIATDDSFVERPLFACTDLGVIGGGHACPDCGHRADAHTVGRSCDVCAVIRAVVGMVNR